MSSSTPSASQSAAAPTSVKRACDACHRRKVKCDGLNPCRNCGSAQLSCTYLAVPQKKGPKGSRAKVISELRETQRQTTLSTKVANRLNGLHSPQLPPSLAPTPGLLTNDVIKDCIEFFFTNMYPTLPILHRGRLEQQAHFVDRDIDTYCLLSSLCAFMMIQPGMPIPGGEQLGLDSIPGANMVSGMMLLEETLRVRKGYDHLENPTLNSLITSFFLFGCFFGLDSHNKAWFHLREATTHAHILNMHKEETYLQMDPIESSRRRRLYWLLFVTERAYALQRHRPLSLQATIQLPTAADDPTEAAPPLNGFIHLVTLFRPFDDMFIALWNKTRTDCSTSYLAALQKQLNDALPAYLNSTESQEADLRTSQQWLKTMVWNLSIHSGCLSSGSNDSSMTFQYPVEIARDLVSMTSQFSTKSMEMHGVGLIEKVFDVACALTDVLSLLPTSNDPFLLGPKDYLHQMLTLLKTLRNGDMRFYPLLVTRMNDILPQLASPMLQTVPEVKGDFGLNPNIDIFDGFGNAGMGVPSQLPVQFDTKCIEDISPMPAPSNSSGNNQQDRDNTPFTSPPIIQSPMEFPGLGDYTGFQDHSGQFTHYGHSHLQAHMQGVPQMPQRQNSNSNNYAPMPRSVPEYHHRLNDMEQMPYR